MSLVAPTLELDITANGSFGSAWTVAGQEANSAFSTGGVREWIDETDRVWADDTDVEWVT